MWVTNYQPTLRISLEGEDLNCNPTCLPLNCYVCLTLAVTNGIPYSLQGGGWLYDSEAVRHPGHFLGFTHSIKYGQHPNAQQQYNRYPLIWMPQLPKTWRQSDEVMCKWFTAQCLEGVLLWSNENNWQNTLSQMAGCKVTNSTYKKCGQYRFFFDNLEYFKIKQMQGPVGARHKESCCYFCTALFVEIKYVYNI
jgi:hypothetical protein